jgi:hypothetical protein
MTMTATLVTLVVASGCEFGDCYSSSFDAMSDVAPDDLDCKPGDIGYGWGFQGRWAEGCGRVAEYSCTSGRRDSCWRCSLIRVQQY